MNISRSASRRMLVKSSVFGLVAATFPNIIHAKYCLSSEAGGLADTVDERYPAIPLSIAGEVVSVSHFNLDRLRELVDNRPELAKAAWDWGFGDWETAIGAASHVGRKDIADYLITRGASPTIFTYAMLGYADAVMAMIKAVPGIQRIAGPHGISLLQHARLGLELAEAKGKARELVNYLESLGDADGPRYLPVADADKLQYLGDYSYGTGKNDGFTIKLNMKKLLSLGKIGKTGGALLRVDDNQFTYNGASSVKISFERAAGKVNALIITEPGLVLKAVKIA